jgi:hypothetical protein
MSEMEPYADVYRFLVYRAVTILNQSARHPNADFLWIHSLMLNKKTQ